MDRENDDQPTGWRSIYSDERNGRERSGADAEKDQAAKPASEDEGILSEETAVWGPPLREPEGGGEQPAAARTDGGAERQPGPPPVAAGGHPPKLESAGQAGRRKAGAAAPEKQEKRPAESRGSKGHPVLWSFLIALGIVVAGAASVLLYVWNGLRPPRASDVTIRVTIDKGMKANKVAEELEKNGLIRNSFLFSAWLKLEGEGSKFQAGEYEMHRGMTREEIVAMLNSGRTVAGETIRFTIPEGFTVAQIADRLAKAGYVDKNAFLAAMSEPEQVTGSVWTKDIPKDADLRYPLEGYLFPETYELKKGATVADIVNRMASELDVKLNELPDDWQSVMQERNLTMHEVLTIASLVEREVVVDSERPIVASVIENRLKKKMPLQIDATIQYLLDKQKEKLTEDDLKVDSPYNTYKHTGLPPGPIASPSLKSIEAVLYPADTDYLYYVTKKDGSNEHLFASTYKQHQKNIQISEQNEKKQQSQK